MSRARPKILMLPRYSNLGPSSRLRMTNYMPQLEAAGFDVDVRPFFTDRYLQDYFATGRKNPGEAFSSHIGRFRDIVKSDADILWIEKEAFPFLPAVFERLIYSGSKPYVVDFDDAVFHGYDQSGSRAVRMLLGGKLVPLIRNSAAIFAGNRYLADYAADAGAANIVDIPTVVDPLHYPVRLASSDGVLRIGWIGTPANARYLKPVVQAINVLADRYPLRLVTIGSDTVPGLVVPQERHGWTEETEAQLLSTIDLGVMPLNDGPFERGKCGYKLIQYMAAGKPVIASPVGVNCQIVTQDVGLLADSVEDWTHAIDQLARDPDSCHRMGLAARQRVEQHYSIQVIAPRIVKSFQQIAAGFGKA